MSRLLTPPEAADKLNVSLRWIRAAVFEQRFPVVKLGRLVRIDERDLDAYIASNRINDKGRADKGPALAHLSPAKESTKRPGSAGPIADPVQEEARSA